MMETPTLLVRAVKSYEAHRPEVLGLGAAALFTFAPLVEGNLGPLSKTALIIVIGLGVGARGLRHGVKRRNALGEAHRLRDEAIRARRDAERGEKRAHEGIRDTLAVFLRNVFERTGLTTEARISVYAFDGDSGFFQLGRYAKHPPFSRTGRDHYPSGEGFLGMAWLEGETYRQDLPSPDDDPEAYRGCHCEAGLSDEVINDLTMPSRSFYGRVLFDPTGNEKVGVVMFESSRPRGVRDVRARISENDLLSLGGLILLLRPSGETAVDEARKRGF